MLGQYLVYYNDKAYIVVRTIKESSKPILNDFKEHLNCDTVLRKDGSYYFCRQVIDVNEESENNISI